MAGKFATWGANLGTQAKADMAEAFKAEGQSLRDDVWQKVIKEGWMGQQTPYDAGHSGASFKPAETEQTQSAQPSVSEADSGPYIRDAEFEEIYEFEGTVWHQEGQQLTDGTQREIERTDIEAPLIEGPEIEPD